MATEALGDTCDKIDPAIEIPSYHCTLQPDHVPTNEHTCDYMVLDPATYRQTPASHSWVDPA